MNMDSILSEQALAQGFHIKRPDDYVLELWRNNALIARFSQTGVDIKEIQHEVNSEIQNRRN